MGQGSGETARQITWWKRDETGIVFKWEGFGVPVLSVFLSNSSMKCPVISERCRIALTNKALTGPCCNVLLCGPSALSTLTERFGYTRHRFTGCLGLILIRSMITTKELIFSNRERKWYFPSYLYNKTENTTS